MSFSDLEGRFVKLFLALVASFLGLGSHLAFVVIASSVDSCLGFLGIGLAPHPTLDNYRNLSDSQLCWPFLPVATMRIGIRQCLSLRLHPRTHLFKKVRNAAFTALPQQVCRPFHMEVLSLWPGLAAID